MGRIPKADLEVVAERARSRFLNVIRVGMSTCGIAAGAEEVARALIEGVRERGLDVEVRKTGCVGACYAEPLVEVLVEGMEPAYYGPVRPADADLILDTHVTLRRPIKRLEVSELRDVVNCLDRREPEPGRQYKIVTRNCGVIDPEDLEDYLARGGFLALRKALDEMSPQDVIAEIEASGLRGRGGAGYPTGLKWRLTREAPGETKYVICNADEGDPGAYMDRSILEGDPFSVIEGMLIAGYAIGASTGYFYIRAEYPLAIERVESAIKQCKRTGLAGRNVLGSDFSMDLEVRLGAGAFVCGEETALISSLEGRRGTPHPRPPYPSEKGLWDCPTSINNVETFANVPPILAFGAPWFKSIGLGPSTGTKVFALTGKVRRPGLVEIPMGMTLRDVIFDIGGGPSGSKAIKAVQTGGPSGGLVPASHFDTPVTYEHLRRLGSMMGSGGMIVMDESDGMVDIARFYLGFCVDESCGKCAPCRIGGKQMLLILERIAEGRGSPEDIDTLRRICRAMQQASLCGLGQSAPNPVLSSLKYFSHEYEQAIGQRGGRR